MTTARKKKEEPNGNYNQLAQRRSRANRREAGQVPVSIWLDKDLIISLDVEAARRRAHRGDLIAAILSERYAKEAP